jgi:RNA polymerase sporulation-specific sigma factor
VLGSDEDNVIYELEQREEREAVRRAVSMLEPRERELIALRYGLNGGRELTQKEVADRLGISQSYISRLEKRILSDLKLAMAGRI